MVCMAPWRSKLSRMRCSNCSVCALKAEVIAGLPYLRLRKRQLSNIFSFALFQQRFGFCFLFAHLGQRSLQIGHLCL